ncbi:MAG TPA: glycosyltransferase [Longimicrobiales bacterium]|nr:glycosyltransferase [Longimicrobiales bacterium]
MKGVVQVLMVLPWLMLALVVPLLWLRGIRLSRFEPLPPAEAELVSVIVPARNEAVNISVCLASLFNSVYPKCEFIVVDDGSTDGTGDIVRILASHGDGRLRLIEGKPLPPGWLGKPWACWQGYQVARGNILLFTDADTRHDDLLLSHAVAALEARKGDREVDLVSILPRQLMLGFWERLILPQIFALITTRYHDLNRVNQTKRGRDVIANGQFMLIRRAAYEAVGGHEALKGEVVEDQRLAQRLVDSGRRIFIAHAQDLMDTRMYRSLRGIIEGWTKNLALGSRQSAPGWAAPIVPWMIVGFLLTVWVAPPALLISGLFRPLEPAVLGWAVTTTALSLVHWILTLVWMRVPALYALGYPVGALASAMLFVRSAIRGRRVEWKGRHYSVGGEDAAAGAPATLQSRP